MPSLGPGDCTVFLEFSRDERLGMASGGEQFGFWNVGEKLFLGGGRQNIKHKIAML